MNFKFLKQLFLSFSVLVGSNASAGIIYDFDVSDGSGLDQGIGDFTGVSFHFIFEDDTDFASLNAGNITGMGFTHDGVERSMTQWTITGLDAIFRFNDGTLRATVGVTWLSTGSISASDNNTSSMLLVVGMGTVLEYVDGVTKGKRDEEGGRKDYLGVRRAVESVPEPSTLAIFALGMIGLASRRAKKQA